MAKPSPTRKYTWEESMRQSGDEWVTVEEYIDGELQST